MPDLSLKRVLDVVVAGTALVASAPLLAVTGAAIVLDSPGPILFAQTRVGRGRQPIRTLKLRTMVTSADRRGSQITTHADPRVTRVGRWLRKTKLDELPQLLNVLRGEMSLVGPRPEVPRFVAAYRPEWEPLFSVRPGLTDLASLTFRDEESLLAGATDHERAYREIIMPMKLALALESVRRSSLGHDVAMLVRTVFSVLGGRTARQEMILDEARRRIEQLEHVQVSS